MDLLSLLLQSIDSVYAINEFMRLKLHFPLARIGSGISQFGTRTVFKSLYFVYISKHKSLISHFFGNVAFVLKAETFGGRMPS